MKTVQARVGILPFLQVLSSLDDTHLSRGEQASVQGLQSLHKAHFISFLASFGLVYTTRKKDRPPKGGTPHPQVCRGWLVVAPWILVAINAAGGVATTHASTPRIPETSRVLCCIPELQL